MMVRLTFATLLLSLGISAAERAPLTISGSPEEKTVALPHRRIKLQQLNVKPEGVITAGYSHAGDFAHQFHIAFSSSVKGSCVFSGQPYHCAVTKFPGEEFVTQNDHSSVPNCDGCPEGQTLIYDHCKNHPQWVDVGMLPDFVRRSCGQNPIVYEECIDDPAELFEAKAFLFQPTHDRCYLDGAVANVQALYGQLVASPEKNVKYVDDQPFPHTLPTNSTPYFNETLPAGYDGPGECLRWVYDDVDYAGAYEEKNLFVFDQTDFWELEGDQATNGTGANEFGAIYIPTDCQSGEEECKMVMVTGGCGGDNPGFGESDYDFAKYGELHNIIVLKSCVGGYFDKDRFTNAPEVQRGLLDVYGQLSSDYAWQSGHHMRMVGKIMKRIMYGQ
ncbi:hypothetical protein TrST_g11323 [Triparma strigata]|uniref:Uncharacterized protein n=1 Tax=Triparma strigata TaxID=1606541 RepID=A0A9W7AMM6_9STRA|nr:hypothetical protein TrST_g11323 [Triparma strigata]